MSCKGLLLIFGLAVARLQPAACSVLKNGGSLKIINGIEAPLHGLPFQAHLYSTASFTCSGALIDDHWILTSAGCVYGANSVVVQLGLHNVDEPEPESSRFLSSYKVVHEDYNDKTFENNIALVYIEPDIPDRTVNVIEIIALADGSKNVTGVTGQISGWGAYLADNEYRTSSVLRYSYDIIISNDECKKYYGSLIKSGMICLGAYTKRSVCTGDSGDPLVVYENGKPILVGILDFARSSCTNEDPAVFTKVSSYIEWIKNNMVPPSSSSSSS